MDIWVVTKIYEENPVDEVYVFGCYSTLEKARASIEEYINRPCNSDLDIYALETTEEHKNSCYLRAKNLGPDLALAFAIERFDCDALVPWDW